MNAEQRFELIKRNTQEIVEEGELKEIIKSKKNPVAYIGFAPTGRMHVGYLIPIMKVGDFVKAGFHFKFLLADLHAFLDDQKTPWELLDARTKYYEECVKGAMDAVGIDPKNIEFVKGSSFQLGKDYILDVLRMVGDVTLNRSKRAASEVVRFKDDPKLGGFIYPILQIEDVAALKADVSFGGIDQRGIYMLGREMLPAMGHKKPVCVFTPLLPGLTGGKMSASDEKSKIDLLDSEKVVEKKVLEANSPAGKVEENGVLAFLKHVVIPLKQDRKENFVVQRPKKFGESLSFKNYEEVEKAYVSSKLHPADLKLAVASELNAILSHIRKRFDGKEKLLKEAYP